MPTPSGISEITAIEDNEYNLEQLIIQLKTNGVIPFVGAGLSIPFGFPSWGGFLIAQADKARVTPEIKKLVELGKYEEAAEIIATKRGYRAFQDAIRNAFGDKSLGGRKFDGAASQLPQLATGPVITTNFDHVLEKAFKQSNHEFEQVVPGVKPDLATDALSQNRRFLLKIHGDVEDSTERVLTQADYVKWYGSAKPSNIKLAMPLPHLLQRILYSGRPLLFLGCSLKADRTIAVLRRVVSEDRSMAYYAILELPEAQQLPERSRFLSNHSIRPIWYPQGRHEWLGRILGHLIGNVATKSQPRTTRQAPRRKLQGRKAGREKEFCTVPELAKLYNFPAEFDGRDECIGLIELGGGYKMAELRSYFSGLGMGVPRITDVSVDGVGNSPASDIHQVTVDLQIAGAAAPGAEFAVYFAPNTDQGFLKAIETAVADKVRKPSVISISWGSTESSWKANALRAMNRAFQNAARAGITVVCAAGDGGVDDGMQDNRAHVDFPGSSPWVLTCGGTTLTTLAGQAAKEVVWNDDASQSGATGGGISEHFPAPPWQSGVKVPRSVNSGAPAGRAVPDVAAHASPRRGYRLLIGGQPVVIGGTAAATPLWAGLIARINQGLGRRIGHFNPILYSRIGPAGFFRGVVEGNNSVRGVPGYEAGPGWNACTGWGSPDGTHLLNAFKLLHNSAPPKRSAGR